MFRLIKEQCCIDKNIVKILDFKVPLKILKWIFENKHSMLFSKYNYKSENINIKWKTTRYKRNTENINFKITNMKNIPSTRRFNKKKNIKK